MKEKVLKCLIDIAMQYHEWSDTPLTEFIHKTKTHSSISKYLKENKILLRKRYEFNKNNERKRLKYMYKFNPENTKTLEEIANDYMFFMKDYFRERYEKRKEKTQNITFSEDEKFEVVSVLIKNNIPKATIQKIMILTNFNKF